MPGYLVDSKEVEDSRRDALKNAMLANLESKDDAMSKQTREAIERMFNNAKNQHSLIDE